MIWGPISAMLSLLPQFEGILLVLMLVFLLAGAGLQILFAHSPARLVRWLPSAICLVLLGISQWIWHTAGNGGQGEGARAAAVMLCFIVLPVLVGAVASQIVRRIAGRRQERNGGNTQ